MRQESSYGDIHQAGVSDYIDTLVEEITIRGFVIMPEVIPQEEISILRDAIDRIYEFQEQDFGKAQLSNIKELDVCRAPLLYDSMFVELAANRSVIPVVEKLIGSYFILNLQNAIINRPGTFHHQSAWHRDLPYQNFVISKPLAVNALYAIDGFSEKTGSTMLIPYAHKMEILPSDAFVQKNMVSITAPAGSVIIFDSMVFHRAGANTSNMVRRAVNHMYTVPIIKQQYDFSRALNGRYSENPLYRQLLGFTSQVPLDDKEWRRNRVIKLEAKR